ncbi:MAG TPA: carboxypeptidase-like regulatory domain-containing protein, partial [Pyrinomonadaceae bacterium]
MQSKFFAKFLTIVFALVLSQSAFAQSTGGLSGTVGDPNGAIVQGANVAVKNTSTNLIRNTVSNKEGRWTISLLPVGVYSVTYEKEGFKRSVNENVEVEAAVTRAVEAVLEVGGADVLVTVTTDQPLVQSESAAIARQITGEEMTKIPTSTRSFTGLLSSEAGVSAELSPVGVNGNGNISPSVNGARTTSTSLFF